MYRIDDATAASSLPAPETAGTEGYFTEGNAAAGTPATNVRGSWLNMIQEELRAIVIAGGLMPSKTSYTQVLTAINTLIQSSTSTFAAPGATNSRVYTAASSSFSLTASRVVAATALTGGVAYAVAGFNKTINLATTGAGGMDTGSAPTSGYVAIYAIYNPTTTTWALLATNATSAAAPEVYAGANMPSGYTASCLVSVWGTTSTANQFRAGLQRGRRIAFPPVVVLSSSTQQASFTSLSISSSVPLNATEVFGQGNPQASTNSNMLLHIAGDGGGVDDNYISNSGTAISGIWRTMVSVAQTIYYSWSNSAGTPSLGISVTGYGF